MLGDNNPNVTRVNTDLQTQLNDVSKFADNLVDKINEVNSAIGNNDNFDNYARNIQATMANIKLYIDDVKNSIDSLQSNDNSNILNGFDNVQSKVRDIREIVVQTFQSIPNDIRNSFGAATTEIENNISRIVTEVEKLDNNIGPTFDSIVNGLDQFNRSAIDSTQATSNLNDELGQLSSNLLRDRDALGEIAQQVKPIINNFDELNKILKVSQENSSNLEKEIQKFSNLNINTISKNETDIVQSLIRSLSATFDKEALNISQNPDEIIKPFEQLISAFGSITNKVESSVKELNTSSSNLSNLGAINRMDDTLNYFVQMNGIIKDTQEKFNSFIDSQNLTNGDAIKNQINGAIEDKLKFLNNIDEPIEQQLAKFRSKNRSDFGQSLNDVLQPGNNDYQFVNMALGNTYAHSFRHDLSSLSHGANDLVHQGERVEDSWRWDSKASNPIEKFRSRRAVDIKGANSEAEDFQRLSASYQSIEKKLMEEINKVNNPNISQDEREQARGLAIHNYRKLTDTQSRMNQSAINLSDHVNVDNRGEYNNLDSGTKKYINQIKDIIKNTGESNRNLISIGAMLGLDKTDDDIQKLNQYKNSLGDIGDTLEKDTTKSKGLFENIKSGLGFLNSGGTTLSKMAGFFGVGALPLNIAGLLGFGSGVIDSYTKQGDYVTQGAMGDLSAGLLGSDSQLRDRVLNKGEQYFRSTNGLIGFQDYNNAYVNLAKNVGGQIGESKQGAAADLNNINENTFSLAKVYDVSDSQMAQTVKTFYKDLKMSADDTITTLQGLAATANASNIPVSQYLQIVTNLATQYRQLGLSGTDASNVMNNLLQSGITNINVAQEMAQGVGSAIGSFGNNRSMAAYSGMMSGQFSDPWHSMAAMENRVDENGNVREGYPEMVAKSIDSMMNLYGGITAGNSGMQFDTIYQFLKTNLHWNDEQANIGADRYLKDPKLFENFIKDNGKINGKTPGEEKDSIQAQTEEFNKQLANAANNLAGTTKVVATLKDIQWNLATESTPLLNSAFGSLQKTVGSLGDQLEGLLPGLLTTIEDVVKSFKNSSIGSGLLNIAENHPLGAIAALLAAPPIIAGATKAVINGTGKLITKGGSKLGSTALDGAKSTFRRITGSGSSAATAIEGELTHGAASASELTAEEAFHIASSGGTIPEGMSIAGRLEGAIPGAAALEEQGGSKLLSKLLSHGKVGLIGAGIVGAGVAAKGAYDYFTGDSGSSTIASTSGSGDKLYDRVTDIYLLLLNGGTGGYGSLNKDKGDSNVAMAGMAGMAGVAGLGTAIKLRNRGSISEGSATGEHITEATSEVERVGTEAERITQLEGATAAAGSEAAASEGILGRLLNTGVGRTIASALPKAGKLFKGNVIGQSIAEAFDLGSHAIKGDLKKEDFGRAGADMLVNSGYEGLASLAGGVIGTSIGGPIGSAIGTGVGFLGGWGLQGIMSHVGGDADYKMKNWLTEKMTGKSIDEIEKSRGDSVYQSPYGASSDTSDPESFKAEYARDAAAKKNRIEFQTLFDDISKAQKENLDKNAQSTHDAVFDKAKDTIESITGLTKEEKTHFENVVDSIKNSSTSEVNKLEELKLVLQATQGSQNGASGADANGNINSATWADKGIAGLAASHEGSLGSVTQDVNGQLSYGELQFNGNTTMSGYLNFMKNDPRYSQIYDKLSQYSIGSDSFNSKFSDISRDPSLAPLFEDSQLKYGIKNWYDPTASMLKSKLGFDASQRSVGVQSMLMSMGINHGPGDFNNNGASYIFKSAFDGSHGINADPNKLSDEDIIKDVYARRSDYVTHLGLSPSTVKALQDRYKEEVQEALSMANVDPISDFISGSGSSTNGIGGKIAFTKPLDSYTITDSYADHLSAGRVGGIDLAAKEGTQIHSATSGTVVESGWNNAWGNTIVVKDSSGKEYRYAHLESPSNLQDGSSVTSGQVIGAVGSTGNSTGPHLHFTEYDKNGNVIDPTNDIMGGTLASAVASNASSTSSSSGSASQLTGTAAYDPKDPSTWKLDKGTFASGTLINNLIGSSSLSSYYSNNPNASFDALAVAQDINNKGGTDGDVTVNQQSLARKLLMNINSASGSGEINNFADSLNSDTSNTYRNSINSIDNISSGSISTSNNPNNYALTVTLDKNGQNDEQFNNFVQQIMALVQNMGGQIKDVQQSISDVQGSIVDTNYTMAANNQIIYNYNRG